MNYFIYTSHHFTPHGRYELNKLTSLPMCGFIPQLVEQRTGNAEVTGSNPVEALIFFFRLLLSNCLNWKIYCDDHSSLSVSFLSRIWLRGWTSGRSLSVYKTLLTRLMKIFILEQATICIWSHQILHVLWLLLKASRG